MAHIDQLAFFENLANVTDFFEEPLKIVEIGSLDINGTIRNLFIKKPNIIEYVGVDIGVGPGVDVVMNGHDYLDLRANEFNIVLSAECLEHNPYWRETIESSISNLKTPGVLVYSWATTGRNVHGTHSQSSESAPFVVEKWNSYYKNISAKKLKSIKNRNLLDYECIFINYSHKDLYWVGFKLGSNFDVNSLKKILKIQKDAIIEINAKYLENHKSITQKKFRAKIDKFEKKNLSFSLSKKIIRSLKVKAKNLYNKSNFVYPTYLKFYKKRIQKNQIQEFFR